MVQIIFVHMCMYACMLYLLRDGLLRLNVFYLPIYMLMILVSLPIIINSETRDIYIVRYLAILVDAAHLFQFILAISRSNRMHHLTFAFVIARFRYFSWFRWEVFAPCLISTVTMRGELSWFYTSLMRDVSFVADVYVCESRWII